jgi:ABC-type sugar transport system ATPase subunit
MPIGIGDLTEKYPAQISGGQKQRVALVLKPKVLLLDEPTNSLDSRLQEKIRQELKSLHRQTGITILHITHNNAEAMFLADRVSILFNGRILPTEAPVVAQFVEASNIFNGHIRHLGERFADVRVTGKHPDNYLNFKMLAFPRFAKSDAVSFCIHPEKVVLRDRPSPENCFPEKITRYVSYGSFIELALDVYGFEINAKVQESIFAGLKLQKDVFVYFPPEAFHPFCECRNRRPSRAVQF